MVRAKNIAAGLLLLIFISTALPAKNVFTQILGAYQKYQEINMTLWLVGDIGAEKRFGKELKFWMGLTHKEEKDPKINAYVKGIFNRLKPHFNNRGMKFDVRVIRNSTANAFVIPGGHVYVYTGLLDMVGSDDELAAVISHELAHAERRHSLKNFRASTAAVAILNKAVKNKKDRETWGTLLGYLTLMQFSRQQEDEADDIGQFRMFKAGFNPAAQVTLWEKFLKKHGDTKGLAQYLGTHPPSSKRVENARNNLKKMNVTEQTVFANTRNILEIKKTNILPNPSFEMPLAAGNLIPHWEKVGGKVALSDRFAITGKNSLLVESPQRITNTRVLSDFIPVGSKSDLKFSCWARSENGQQNVAIGVELYDSNKRLRNRVWAVRESSLLPPKWTKIEARMVNSDKNKLFADNIAFMRIILQTGLISIGTVWFDEISLSEFVAQKSANLIENGDFEMRQDNGSPEGVIADNAEIKLDYKVFNSGYASLCVNSLSDSEAGFAIEPISIEMLKPGWNYTCSYYLRASQDLKGLIIVDILDKNSRPLARRLVQKEFAAARDKWLADSFLFKYELNPEELKQAKSIQLRLVGTIPTGTKLWIDTMVMR